MLWTNTTGSWQDAANWSPQVVPNGNFDVTIPATGSPVLDGPVTVNSLADFGSVSGDYDITVSNLFTLTDAALGGAGTLFALGGIAFNGSDEIDQRVIDNSGVATWTGTNTTLVLSEGAAINNLSNGVFQIVGDATLADGDFPLGVFNNHGLFEKTQGDGITAVQVEFGNSGTVNVNSGTVSFQQFGFNSGGFEVSTGAVCEFANAEFTLAPGTTLAGGGLYVMDNAAVVNLTTDLTVNRLALDATLASAKTLSVAQSLDFRGGQLSGSGTTIFLPGSVITFTNGINRAINRQTINNSGTVIWGDDAWIALDNGAVFNNLSNGVFNITGDGQVANTVGPQSVFNNDGLFEKTAGTNVTVMEAFTNTGTVNLQIGTVAFADGYFQASGTTEIGGSSVLNFPLAAMQGDLVQTGGSTEANSALFQGNVSIRGGDFGGWLQINGNLYNNGNLNLGDQGMFVVGNFTQGSLGTLKITMDKYWYRLAESGSDFPLNVYDDTQSYDAPPGDVFHGNIKLAGTLEVTMTSDVFDYWGYDPANFYNVVVYSGSRSGWFDRVLFNGPFPQFSVGQIQEAGVAFAWFTQPQITAGAFTNGQFHIPVTGPGNETVLLETSTNMINWMPLLTNTLQWTNGSRTNCFTDLTDPTANHFRSRFYRTRVVGYEGGFFP